MLDFLFDGSDGDEGHQRIAAPAAGPINAAGPIGAGAADGAADPLPPGAGGRGRGRGRGRGDAQRLLNDRAAAQHARTEDALEFLSALANPTLEQRVSQQFAFLPDALGKTQKEAATVTCAAGETAVIDKRRQMVRLKRRALTSHIQGMRSNLVGFIGEVTEIAISSEVADDATMWTRLPVDAVGAAAEALKPRLRKRKRAEAKRAPGKQICRSEPRHSLLDFGTTPFSQAKGIVALARGANSYAQHGTPTRQLAHHTFEKGSLATLARLTAGGQLAHA